MGPIVESDMARCFAGAVRAGRLRFALKAHEDARVRGLCQEGRLEAAIATIRFVDLDSLLVD